MNWEQQLKELKTKWPRDLRGHTELRWEKARSPPDPPGCPGEGHGAGDTNPSLTTFLHVWGSNL